MTRRVVGVIVAAGESSRMGRPKQLLMVGDRPLLQWVVDAAEASALDEVIVVSGHSAADVRAGIRLSRAIWSHNSEPGRGTMSSLRAGVAAAGDADAIMKLVGDQPEVSTEVIDALADNWDQDPAHSSLVRYQDGDGHPMLVGMAALTEIIDRDGDRLLWPLMAGEGGRVSRLVIARMRPIDVNTPEDVRAVSVRLGCSSGNAPTA